jgi:hypothetical protein
MLTVGTAFDVATGDDAGVNVGPDAATDGVQQRTGARRCPRGTVRSNWTPT